MAQRVLYPRTDGKWAWRLVADNGRTIATDGGQGYENEADARRMADLIIGGQFKYAEKRIIAKKPDYHDLAKILADKLAKY